MPGANERRTLEIQAQLRDFVSKNAKRMLGAITRFVKGAVGAFRGLISKVTSLKNIFLGLFVVLAARRAFQSLKQIADDLDLIIKTSDKVNATTKSLQELRFVAELNAVNFSSFTNGLAVFSKNLDQAREGSKIMEQNFARLGITMENLPLGAGGKVDLIELLARTADEMKTLENRTVALAAAQNVFGRQGKELGVILSLTGDEIRKLAQEASDRGLVIDDNGLRRAAEFNDSLTRLNASIDAIKFTLFTEIAPALAGVFTRLADIITQNRDQIVDFFRALGRGFLEVLQLMLRGIIGFVRKIEDVTGPLIDEDAIRKRIETLKSALPTNAFGQSQAEEMLRSPFETAARFQDDPAMLRRLDEIRELEAQLEAGLAGALEKGLDDGIAKVAEFEAALQGAFSGAAAGRGSTSTGTNVFTQMEESLRGLEQQRGLLLMRQDLLSLKEPTAAVRAELDEIAAQLRALDFERAFEEGRITASQLNEAIADIERGLERSREGSNIIDRQQFLLAREQILGLMFPTEQVTQELEKIGRELREIEFRKAFEEGVISAEEMSAALANLDRDLQEIHQRVDEGFWEGFKNGASDAAAELTDLQAQGEQAAGSLTNALVDGLADTLTDVILGIRSAKEAFREFAKQALRDITRMIVKMLIMQALQGAIGFFGGGVGGGAGGGAVQAAAKGGVFHGSIEPPFQAFARGGVASRPTMALFGEAGAEAFVPLQGGKIPVDLKGASRGPIAVSIQINAVDATGVDRLLVDKRTTIESIISNAIETKRDMRQTIREVG